ncbi:hypothetical protein F2Q69_00044320 [Brassica cretica]|uniref:Fatty acyl-CoA reductase n=1 Tax=Brassica cretica TaxID=69181 RepID=A0A8S9NIE1_BRACR|nr:hypothetical protein F2Q69_00044320 [Brassica cretica]
MESNRVKFLENKTLLVTGASGFLAKVFVERVLSLQPNVKRLYLLVRASGKKSAEQRLHSEVFEKDLFRVLRNNIGDETLNALISEKVVPVPGDTSLNNMGVTYVCGERSGLIQEIPFAMGETLHRKNKVDINTEMQLVEQKSKQLAEQGCSEEETKHAMRDLGLKRAKLFGLPNTYAFTKVMGEMFLGHYRENMSIVIIRPTMNTSTFSDPFPGWIEGVKTLDTAILSYGKGMLTCFLIDQKAACDIIPVDMVANAMIATAAEHFNDSGSHTVYHVASSYRNPIIYKQIANIMNRYFKKSPLLGRSGMPIVPKDLVLLSTMAMFRLYMGLRFKLPLQMLGLLSITFPSQFGDKYQHHNREFKMAMRLVKIYEPYLLFKGIFDDKNLETLRIKNEAKERNDIPGFSPKCVDWEIILSIHISLASLHTF